MAWTLTVLTYRDAGGGSRPTVALTDGTNFLPLSGLVDDTGAQIGTAAKPLPVSIVTSSADSLAGTEAATLAAGQTPLALALSLAYGFDGTTWSRLRAWTNALGVSEKAAAGTPTSGVVTVDTTATGVVVKAANASRRRITVVNHGTVDVFIGFDTSLTAANGALLVGVKGASLSFFTTAQIRAICASSAVVGYDEEVLA